MSNREQRTLSVPEGVAGERIDSALTRVLGLSRTAVVKLLEDGDITTSGKAMAKSDRVSANQVIDVLMPAPINQDPIPLTPLEGLSIVYDDDAIVVICIWWISDVNHTIYRKNFVQISDIRHFTLPDIGDP